MQKITPFLWFNNNAEEAMNFYISIFKNSKMLNVMRNGDAVLSVTFQLEGQQFMALNGGPHFKFTEAISLFVHCETQEEVDDLWKKLTAGGGGPSQCGWLKNKFGAARADIPSVLLDMLAGKGSAKCKP